MLIEVLLCWEKQGTAELPPTQLAPMFVNPARTFAQILGDLLGGEHSFLDGPCQFSLGVYHSPAVGALMGC